MQSARIEWKIDKDGKKIPFSSDFDDVYFCRAGGLDESRYVFVEQNRLAARFEALFQSKKTRFVVAELGFGSGLNFLATWEAWQNVAAKYPDCAPKSLYFISFEKFPLRLCDLSKALETWRDDRGVFALAQKLIAAYPPLVGGCHRRYFETQNGHNLALDLRFGDAAMALLDLQKTQKNGVDAWFLDGFSPKKNPSLWSDTIFESVKALSNPGATLATFSAAGDVRRKLLRVGALPAKVKGFGKKREMLTAVFAQTATNNPTSTTADLLRVAIIGGGVSGLCAAYALARLGARVDIFDKSAPLAGASGNLCALFSPKLNAHGDFANDPSLMGFLYSRHFYQSLQAQSGLCVFEQTGVVDYLQPTKKNREALLRTVDRYPDALAQAKTKSDPFCAFLPKAGLVYPKALAAAVLQHKNIRFVPANVHAVDQKNGGVLLRHSAGNATADAAIVCAGFESHNLHAGIFRARRIRGQVSHCQHQGAIAALKKQHRVLKYDGYACVFLDENGQERLLFGASFARNDQSVEVRQSDHAFNLGKLRGVLGDLPCQNQLQGRAGVRAQTPDYKPLVGEVATGVYALCAMGSKGFSLAPFCAEILASRILGAPCPASSQMVAAFDPRRDRLKTPLDHST